jgi:hypothetical protein
MGRYVNAAGDTRAASQKALEAVKLLRRAATRIGPQHSHVESLLLRERANRLEGLAYDAQKLAELLENR